MKNNLALFEENNIRKIWKDNKWYFSIVDIIYALTNSSNPRDYWYKMKIRVNEEEKAQLSTICRQLKLKSSDGKSYMTDCSDTEGILRIIQSILSLPTLASHNLNGSALGEGIDEINDPELAMNRMKEIYGKKGYSKSWIEQRERYLMLSTGQIMDIIRKRGYIGKYER